MISVALFKPEIAGNVGNIIRTCVCLGIKKLIIIMPCGFTFDDRKFKRSAMDYANQDIEIIKYANFEDFKSQNTQSRIILMTTKTDNDYYDFQWQDNDIILFGSESSGVSDDVRRLVDTQITIPINGRSLNLAISCGIVVSKATRYKY